MILRASQSGNLATVLSIIGSLFIAQAARAALHAPENFEVTSNSSNLQLDWSVVQDPQVGGYLVYYDTDGPEEPFEGVGALEGSSPIRVEGADVHSLALSGLTEGTHYYISVAAFDRENLPGTLADPRVGVLCDVLPPAAPTGLTVSYDDSGVHLAWTGNSEVDANGTSIFRGTTPTPTDSIAFVELPTATYDEAFPGFGQTFYYAIRAVDYCGITGPFSEVVAVSIPPQFTRGDVDANGVMDVNDPIYNLDYQFNGGPPPPCMDAADDDDSGTVDPLDPVYSLHYLFQGGPPPSAPFPGCGFDPTEDALTCSSFPPCGPSPIQPVLLPTDGAEILDVERISVNSETVRFAVNLETGTPLFGAEGTLAYDAAALHYEGLERTAEVYDWDYLSASADAEHGTIRIGAIPDLHLQRSIPEGATAVAVLVFTAQAESEESAVAARDGRFVARDGRSIRPDVERGSSSVPGPAGNGPAPRLTAVNPFRPGSTIAFADLAAGQPAEISVFTVGGERVRVLFHGSAQASEIRISWDGRTQAGQMAGAGVYYLRASNGNATISRKLLLLP